MFLSRSLRQSVVMTHDHSPLSTPLEESPDPEIPAPLWTESGPTTQPAADTDDTLPAFAVSSSGTVFTAGELAGGTEVPAAMSIPPAAPLPGSLGFPESSVRTTPSSITTGTTSGAASPMSVPVVEGKRSGNGWAKPALVGGLVGAVLSSAVLGTALVATRRDNNTKATTATTTVSAASSSPSTSSRPISVIDEKMAGPLKIREILTTVQPAVVSIATQSGFSINEFDQTGAGTGMVVTSDGYILTNNHVIASATTVKVTFSDRKVRNAVVVGTDPSNDVALIKVNATGLPSVKLGKSKALQVGDQVVAIGNALALPGGPTVTTGIVSALNRSLEGDGETLEGLIQTDAAINPGNSGGPLVNSAGEVVGMNTAIIRNTANIGFSIASDRFSPILDKLKANAKSNGDVFKPRTFLGVTMYELTPDLVERFGLGTDKGVLVADVNIGSPADNAGLQAGDVVVKFDGKTVTRSEELKDLVQARKPGDVVVVSWVTRDGRKMEANIELGSARRVTAPAVPVPDNANPFLP